MVYNICRFTGTDIKHVDIQMDITYVDIQIDITYEAYYIQIITKYARL